jgi:hypothetical protein
MKWTRKNGREYYGPHWITSRRAFEKSGVILALLDHAFTWRGAWMDKCGNMHWEWFTTKAAAKIWVEQMAQSKKAAALTKTATEEATAQSADQLAAIAAAAAADALAAYAAALDHAADVAKDNAAADVATARRMAATQARDFAAAARRAASRLS